MTEEFERQLDAADEIEDVCRKALEFGPTRLSGPSRSNNATTSNTSGSLVVDAEGQSDRLRFKRLQAEFEEQRAVALQQVDELLPDCPAIDVSEIVGRLKNQA